MQTIIMKASVIYGIYMGSFKNHVDKILLIFDHPPTFVYTFYVLNVDKNGKFQTTYPPSVVHVVFESSQK